MKRYGKEILSGIIEELKQYERIVIWGAGSAGEAVYNGLCESGLKSHIIGFCDKDAQKWGNAIDGKEIYGYSMIKERFGEVYFVICSTWWREIKQELGINNEKYYIWPFFYIKNSLTQKMIEEWNLCMDKQVEDKIKRLESMLADEESKNVLHTLISVRESGEIELLGQIDASQTQYFDQTVWKLSEKEVFLDVGAYDGDTMMDFLRVTHRKYKRIIELEPDIYNFNQLKQVVKNKGLDNVELHNVGAWNEETELRFSNGGSASTINESGEQVIKTQMIDNLFMDLPISLIKMDIEGAEREAIMGASNVIQKYKPKLAICVYHKLDDLYEIPFMIKELVPKYKLYLRHYGYALDETVCYAIINE